MIEYLLWILFILFLLKIGWNLYVPYALIFEFNETEDDEATKGISLMFELDVGLLILICLIFYLSNQQGFFQLGAFFWIGLAIFVGSIIHLFVASMIVGSIVHYFRKRNRNKTQDSH